MTAAGELASAVSGCLRGLADLILPETCAGCGAPESGPNGLCPPCNVRLLGLVGLSACPRCGSTVGPNIPLRPDGCAACPDVLPRYACAVRLGPYADPLRGLVRGLKYGRTAGVRRDLGRMLAEAVRTRAVEHRLDVVLPVPMHWWRRLTRGVDHARLLAAAVARELDLPLGDDLFRVRNTPPQTHLPRTRRIENVRGAFSVRRPSAVAGAGVLLVDDVTTTGATADEAARTLRAAGASGVVLAVLAKAEPPTAYAFQGAQP